MKRVFICIFHDKELVVSFDRKRPISNHVTHIMNEIFERIEERKSVWNIKKSTSKFISFKYEM